MEEYGKLLIITMPIFLTLIVIEKLYGWYKKEDHTPIIDSVASINSGITNSVKDILGISITLLSYEWMVSKVAFFPVENTLAIYLIAFIAIDFYGYWSHRLAHQINFLWNKHAIHHSSEEFNLACALRQPIASLTNLFIFLLFPAALLGVPATVIALILPLHLFLQFWYHTRHIKKLGFLEHILVTPSHHRVHHAINSEYLDRNHGQIFIFWDKIFGTFQEELDTVPPVFGITRPAQTWNPIKINFQHLTLLVKDAWRAEHWNDKLTIWFKPTGWRPENFEEKYPVVKIEDVYNFEKYGLKNSRKLEYWSIIQMLITLLFVTYLFSNIATIGLPQIFVYGFFILVSIYSASELLDKSAGAVFWEFTRLVLAVSVIVIFKDWFGLNTIFKGSSYIVIVYCLLSTLVAFYFMKNEFQLQKKL